MYTISILSLVVLVSCLTNVKAATCATGNRCQNGATCVDAPLNSHICICTAQWTGDLCDYPVGTTTNACTTNPCLNGGTCSLTGTGGFVCSCPAYYTGTLCEQNIGIIPTVPNNPCLNGGTCVYTALYGYRCVCAYGYTGARCEYLCIG